MDELHAIHHPHDALFKAVFGDPEQAGELLRSALPTDITTAIDWRTLRPLEGTFVDEALCGQQADLLFTAAVAGRPTLLYVLLEHKADEDPFTAFQLLRYVVRIWERHCREQPHPRRLPPVVPLVLHHGKKAWQGPRELRALIDLAGLPDLVGARQPAFTFSVDDLAGQDEGTLRSRRLSVRTLLPLLHLQWLRRRTDTAALLRAWHPLYRALLRARGGRPIAYRLVSYVAAVSSQEPELLRLAYHDLDPAMETHYMTTAEQLLQRGRTEGLEHGLQQGLQQASAHLVATLLVQRFGPLPEATSQRIRNSTPAELERMARAILAAASLDDVLAT